jgi:hypothetical protein
VVNLDPATPAECVLELPLAALRLAAGQEIEVEEILSGDRFTWAEPRIALKLDPAENPAMVFRVL